jgi:hypothetical protein
LTVKEMEEISQKFIDESYTPTFGATSFAELADAREARQMEDGVLDAVKMYPSLVSNILYNSEITDKSAAVDKLNAELSAIIQDGWKRKEIQNMVKAVWSAAYKNDLPDSAFLFVESGGEKDSEGKTTPRSLRHLPYKDKEGNVSLEHVQNAISRASQVKLKDGNKISSDKAASIQARARKILKSAQKSKAFEILESIKGFFIEEEESPEEENFFIWKDTDTGRWRWLSAYSNNLRDREEEIISEHSHLYFLDRVEKEQAPYPELWLWHVPQWKIGQADFLAYDDTGKGIGFAIASGTIDDGKEDVAFWLSTQKDFKVSHGMPTYTIMRDPEDERIIVQHETREISPLPGVVAANERVVFMLDKENDMSIPDGKKKVLAARGLPEDIIDDLEEQNSRTADKAIEDEIDAKEKDDGVVEEPTAEVEDVEVVEETTHVEVEDETDETEEEEVLDDEQSALNHEARKEIAEGLAAYLRPVLDNIDSTMKALDERLSALEGEKAEEVEREEKEIDRLTPAASVGALLSEKMGIKGEPIADDDRLVDQKPKETEADDPFKGATGISLIDGFISHAAQKTPQRGVKVSE